MTTTRNKSWALSSYADNKSNLFIEIRCINNQFKGWAHLDSVNLIVQSKDTDPANGLPIKEKTIQCTQYFNRINNKYFPLDSLNNQMGILQIPFKNRKRSMLKSLPTIDNQYKSSNLVTSKNNEGLNLKFVFIDNNGHKATEMTSTIKRTDLDN